MSRGKQCLRLCRPSPTLVTKKILFILLTRMPKVEVSWIFADSENCLQLVRNYDRSSVLWLREVRENALSLSTFWSWSECCITWSLQRAAWMPCTRSYQLYLQLICSHALYETNHKGLIQYPIKASPPTLMPILKELCHRLHIIFANTDNEDSFYTCAAAKRLILRDCWWNAILLRWPKWDSWVLVYSGRKHDLL